MTKQTERTFANIINEDYAVVEARAQALNDAIRSGDLKLYTAAEEALKEAEATYLKDKRNAVYEELAATKEPVREALTRLEFQTVAHKINRENGITTDVTIHMDKNVRIDLLEFCRRYGIACDWKHLIDKYRLLLAFSVGIKLGFSTDELRAMNNSQTIMEIIRKKEEGKTPDSNTSLVKGLQEIFDAILFDDNGKGKNVHKVLNKDVEFLTIHCFKGGKKAFQTDMAKEKNIQLKIWEMMSRVLRDARYTLTYEDSLTKIEY